MAAALSLALTTAAVLPAHAQTTELVSKDSSGNQGMSRSVITTVDRAISADGSRVAFSSLAENLVAGDTNGAADIFMHDLTTGSTKRVSVASDGTEAKDGSYTASISADGTKISFFSYAPNLVAGDTNGLPDVFVHDLATSTTKLATVASDGKPANSYSYYPSISADGSAVAFESLASNLVAGDTNSAWDIFVHDLTTASTNRVSVASDGTEVKGGSRWPSISADATKISFWSLDPSVVAGDTNGASDIFVHDLTTGRTNRVSVASDGEEGSGHSYWASISADGSSVAFPSYAADLVAGDTNHSHDVFVHDLTTGSTKRVSVASDGTQAKGGSFVPSINADGSAIAFGSYAADLVAGDTNHSHDVFVHDLTTATTERVSVASDGTQANRASHYPSISANGSAVAFWSYATNLVPGGTNGYPQVFVHNRTSNSAPVADAGPDQTVACDPAATPVTLDGSGSSDPDNDPLTYSWTNSFGSASGVSPTFDLGLGNSTITLVVNDGALDSDPDTVDITVAADVEGLLAPLAALVPEGDEPPLPDNAFKQKRTLPLKLHLFCGTQALTDANVSAPEIYGLTAVGEAPLNLETIDADSGEANDSGVHFRYSTDGEWVHNLKTRSLSAGKVYQITIEMPDGLRHAARFALK